MEVQMSDAIDHYIADHPQVNELWHCKARMMPSGEVCPVRELCQHFAAISFNWIYDRYAPEPCGISGCRYFLKIGLPDQKDDYTAVKELLGRKSNGRPKKNEDGKTELF